MPTVCPGQDTRYWRPSDIFDVTCGVCGKQVEFFKDDVTRRCRACGTVIRNPRISLGCAQWCEHAKECLGYDPKELLREEAEGGSLLDELIASVKISLGADPSRLNRALTVVEEAEELLRQVEANRRIVLVSALLQELEPATGQTEGNRDCPEARQILSRAGVDTSTAAEVCQLISGLAAAPESIEARLLRDAVHLARLRETARQGTEPSGEELASLETEVARSRGRQLVGSIFPA